MLAKRFGFGFGIAVILPLLVHYGVSTFTPAPKWQEYYQSSSVVAEETAQQKTQRTQERQKQEQEFRHKQKTFERNLFFVAAPVGIAAVVVGSFAAVQAVGAGLIFGGIFTTIDGYCWYWTELADWMRFLSLLIAFAVLVGLGYTKLNDKGQK